MDRGPLSADALRAALCAPDGPYAAVEVVARTGSTNADLAAAAVAGAADRTVLVAEYQDGGRGRLDRAWVSPPGAGLTLSVLFRPVGVPAERLGWVPLLAGLALRRAVTEHAGVSAELKWPNDLLVGPARGKVAGVLAEAVAGPAGTGPGVVLGIGLNVSTTPEELPAGGTSLRLAGAPDLDRTGLAIALLDRLSTDEAGWRSTGGDPRASGLHADYRAACATIGSPVRAELPGGVQLVGTAVDVDTHGRLLIYDPMGRTVPVAAGDVVHLRAIR